jgi:hypothetical protein
MTLILVVNGRSSNTSTGRRWAVHHSSFGSEVVHIEYNPDDKIMRLSFKQQTVRVSINRATNLIAFAFNGKTYRSVSQESKTGYLENSTFANEYVSFCMSSCYIL